MNDKYINGNQERLRFISKDRNRVILKFQCYCEAVILCDSLIIPLSFSETELKWHVQQRAFWHLLLVFPAKSQKISKSGHILHSLFSFFHPNQWMPLGIFLF